MKDTEWESEWREYFTKALKPKKPTLGNLDLELSVDFITKQIALAQTESMEEIERNLSYLIYNLKNAVRHEREGTAIGNYENELDKHVNELEMFCRSLKDNGRLEE